MKKKYVLAFRNSVALQRWLTRRDGVIQRYHVLPSILDEPKDYTGGPVPARTVLMTGDYLSRVRFVTSYLRKHYPHPEGREIAVSDLRPSQIPQFCADFDLSETAVRGATMFFYYPLATIFINAEGRRLMESRVPQEWAAGVYRLTHEWYHAMRRDKAIFYPVEEGAAELFAQEVAGRMIRAEHPVYQVDKYRPLMRGVRLLTDLVAPQHSLVQWLMLERITPLTSDRLRNESAFKNLPPAKLESILYTVPKRNSYSAYVQWEQDIRSALGR